MIKDENRNDDLMQSQKCVLEKVEKINKMFERHFSFLSILLIFTLGNVNELLISFLHIDIMFTERYGLIGIIFIQVGLIMIFTFITAELLTYLILMIRKYSIKIIQMNIDNLQNKLYYGILRYVNNISIFYKQSSQGKLRKRDLMTLFLAMNLFIGLWLILIFIFLEKLTLFNIFISLTWFGYFLYSFRFRKRVLKWDEMIPKLDKWAQELEKLPSDISKRSDTTEQDQDNKQASLLGDP